MQEEEKKCLKVEEFKKAQYDIELAHTLVVLIKEYFLSHYGDEEGTYEMIPVLNCVQERLCKVCVSFMEIKI